MERGLFSPGKPAVCKDSRKVLDTSLSDWGMLLVVLRSQPGTSAHRSSG